MVVFPDSQVVNTQTEMFFIQVTYKHIYLKMSKKKSMLRMMLSLLILFVQQLVELVKN